MLETFNDLGHELKRRRLQRLMTLEEAGNSVGLTTTAMHYLETGVQPVGLQKLKDLCTLFGIPFNEAKEVVRRFKIARLDKSFEQVQ